MKDDEQEEEEIDICTYIRNEKKRKQLEGQETRQEEQETRQEETRQKRKETRQETRQEREQRQQKEQWQQWKWQQYGQQNLYQQWQQYGQQNLYQQWQQYGQQNLYQQLEKKYFLDQQYPFLQQHSFQQQQKSKVIQYTNDNEKRFTDIIAEKNKSPLPSFSNSENTQTLNNLTRVDIEKLEIGKKIIYDNNAINILKSYYNKMIKSYESDFTDSKKPILLPPPLVLVYTEKIDQSKQLDLQSQSKQLDLQSQFLKNDLSYYTLIQKNLINNNQILCPKNNMIKFEKMVINEKFQVIVDNNWFDGDVFKKEKTIVLFQRSKYTFQNDVKKYDNNKKFNIMLNGVAKRNCTDFIIISLVTNKDKHVLYLYTLITEIDQQNLLAHYIMLVRYKLLKEQKPTLPRRMLESFSREYVWKKKKKKLPLGLQNIKIDVVSDKGFLSSEKYQLFRKNMRDSYQDIVYYGRHALVTDLNYYHEAENNNNQNDDDDKSIPYATLYFPNVERNQEGEIVDRTNEMIVAKFDIYFQILVNNFQVYDDSKEMNISQDIEDKKYYDSLFKTKTMISFKRVIFMDTNQTIYIVVKNAITTMQYKFALNLISINI